MASQLLWIGLGNMGRVSTSPLCLLFNLLIPIFFQGMCSNLVQKGSLGKPLLVYNRTQKRSDDFVTQVGAAYAKASNSLREGVSSSDIIFSCLGSDSAVTNVYETIINESDIRGKLFVECSTISPELVDKVAELVAEHGAELVSSPGKPIMAVFDSHFSFIGQTDYCSLRSATDGR